MMQSSCLWTTTPNCWHCCVSSCGRRIWPYQNRPKLRRCPHLLWAEQPELMILDINLPDGDGFSLFRALRAKADVPALFLSARDADADRLFGLGLGADDYLTKPFLMQELLLRVQHILQRAYRAELSRTKPAPLQLGERCVDLNDAIVTLPEGKHWR